MTEERTTPLRQRMIDDMRIRGMGEKAQSAHIRVIRDFAVFLGRSPDTATPEELRAYQPYMTNAGMTPSTFNVRIVSLRVVGTYAAPLARRFPPTLRHDLRARRDEAVHAVPAGAAQTARSSQCRGGR